MKVISATDGVEEGRSAPDVVERVVCGIDGSPESLEALHQLERLRPANGELHLVVRVLAATGGKPVDFDGLRGIEDLDRDELRPVDALVAASRATDLVVLGSRGLHGVSRARKRQRAGGRPSSQVGPRRAGVMTLATGATRSRPPVPAGVPGGLMEAATLAAMGRWVSDESSAPGRSHATR